MKLFRFLFSRVFFLNLLLSLLLLVGGYFWLVSYLEDYTEKGITTKVPDIKEMHIDAVPEKLEALGFRWELSDSSYNNKLKKGIVIKQDPAAGVEVKNGRKIYISINARTRKKIKLHLENVVSFGPRQAIPILESMDVKVDTIEYEESIHPDIVLAVKDRKGRTLKNGDEIFAGTGLKLVVSKRGDKEVKVPMVTGLSINKAIQTLMANKLNHSVMAVDKRLCGKIDSSTVKIIQQNPKPHTEQAVGTPVILIFNCDTLK